MPKNNTKCWNNCVFRPPYFDEFMIWDEHETMFGRCLSVCYPFEYDINNLVSLSKELMNGISTNVIFC